MGIESVSTGKQDKASKTRVKLSKATKLRTVKPKLTVKLKYAKTK
jgi:hypothetical protein